MQLVTERTTLILMSNPNTFRPADIIEAQNHAAEMVQRARKAVREIAAELR